MGNLPLILVHRAGYPENTLEAVKFSLNSGAEGIEIDLRSCNDEIVVFHDATLERATKNEVSLKIEDMNYSELSKIKIFGGNFIPKIQDLFPLLEVVEHKFYVKLDIKDYDKRMKSYLYSLINNVRKQNNKIIFMIDLDEEIEKNARMDLFNYWKDKRTENLLLEVPGSSDRKVIKGCDVVGYTFNEKNIDLEIPPYVKDRKMTDIYIEKVEDEVLWKILLNLRKYNPTFITPNYSLNLRKVKELIRKCFNY